MTGSEDVHRTRRWRLLGQAGKSNLPMEWMNDGVGDLVISHRLAPYLDSMP